MPYRIAALIVSAVALVGPTAAPAHAQGPRPDGSGACAFPMRKQMEGTPWPLQRVLLDELWQETRGKGVRVAVIDTGVDTANPQLRNAVDATAGADFVPAGGEPGTAGHRVPAGAGGSGAAGTVDEVGHGTKVAGIIAARPRAGTGFVGLAPEATIIPIRQNDGKNNGTSDLMALAIDHAVAKGARVINISQDTTQALTAQSDLGRAVARALAADVVVVASAGNDGMDGRSKNTYPAAFPGVLAVAASDRNNERAAFSQSGAFVGVAAPGVDVVSTVPGNGQCADNGTSFSAPYVSGVAALLRAKYPRWKAHQVVAQIEQTAERSVNGRDDHVGWGVVDPLRALDGDAGPPDAATPDPAPPAPPAPEPAPLAMTESAQERDLRLATYALASAAVLLAVVTGTATVLRDSRRKRAR